MKKKSIIVIIIIVLLIFLVPIPNHLRDGGTVEYKALLYKVTKVHRLISNEEIENTEQNKEYADGVIIEILGFEIYNNVNES